MSLFPYRRSQTGWFGRAWCAIGTRDWLRASGGNFVARGLFNSQSKIAVRLYCWEQGIELDAAFFRACGFSSSFSVTMSAIDADCW